MANSDMKWFGGAVVAVVVAAAAPVAVLQALGSLDTSSDKRFAAVLALVGVAITACVAILGELVRRQGDQRLQRQHEDEEARLRLDAAMRAGTLFNGSAEGEANPAAIASGLLALTQLGRADLAVALLVHLWDGEEPSEAARSTAVPHEIAILILDAALRSQDANAQLVAAELLCRNASRLDVCQSLHWPASVDGEWNPAFGTKTKVLVVDALVRMAVTSAPSLNALQSLAVRLYGISAGDPDTHVKGCLGMLLTAIVPALEHVKVTSLMQGPSEITIADIRAAAGAAHPNRDRVLYRVVMQRCEDLAEWAKDCDEPDYRPGALAAASHSGT
jgi:hypothetical protein